MPLRARPLHAVLFSTLLWSIASSALGLPETTWTDSQGRFSLDFRPLGWNEFSIDAAEGDILMIERGHTEVDGDTPICVVTGHAQPTPASMTQANVNTISSARHRDMLESTAGIPTSSQLVDVDGVVTIDAIYNGPTYRHIRLFYLGDGVTLTQILIDCSVDGPVSSDVSSNIGALIGTLRIGTR